MAWFDASWTYRRKITIDSDKVSGAETDFPVVIDETHVDFKTTGNGGNMGLASGEDMVFTSSNGTTQLKHEIELYNASTGHIVCHVKIPSLASAVDTEIYLYYGNAAASAQSDKANVWDSNFVVVQHQLHDTLADNNSTGITDVVTLDALTEADDSIDGLHGKCIEFNKADGESVNYGDDTYTRISPQITIECLYKRHPTAPTGLEMIVFKYKPNSGYILFTTTDNNIHFDGRDGGGYVACTPRFNINDNTWHYLYAHIDGSKNWVMGHDNQVNEGTTTGVSSGNIAGNGQILQFGQWNTSYPFDGSLCEVRLSDIKRSDNWRMTTWENQINTSTFYALGTEETDAPSAVLGDIYCPTATEPWAGDNFINTVKVSGGGDRWFRVQSNIPIDTSFDIINDTQKDTAFDIIDSWQKDTSWDIVDSWQKDASWDIVEDFVKNTAWDIVDSWQKDTSWDIVNGWQKDTAWDIIDDIAKNTSWDILNVTSKNTSWDIIEDWIKSISWDVLNDFTKSTSWNIFELIYPYVAEFFVKYIRHNFSVEKYIAQKNDFKVKKIQTNFTIKSKLKSNYTIIFNVFDQ